MGTDESLDKYEKGLASHFELKIKGRLGLGPNDGKEMRVLNRIVRVNADGLQYEADPRHVELLAKSLGLADSKPVATPGVKKPFEDAVMDLELNEDLTTTTLASATIRISRVKLSENVTIHEVLRYSDQYPLHPRSL